MRKSFFFIVLLVLMSTMSALAQQRSAKRGVCWDEKTQALTAATIAKMAPGISWLYTWGESPVGTPANLDSEGGMAFLPMTWNGNFNETKLRNYLKNNPNCKYLLAFNEPNLETADHGGSEMTPQQAANAWPKVKQIAADYGLKIVAPALNFTGDYVGGKVWEPFAWYDEFFRLVPDANVDYLAFHTYMNYYTAVDWVATEYFYTDKETGDLFYSTNKAKYPNLVKYMEDYKAAHGHYPKMFLTEFCSFQGNEYPYTSAITLDFQIDQMIQKVQCLELSDMVEGYAWFMGNTGGGASAWPYMSIFQTNTSTSNLSTLGQVYVYMSSFDLTKYYTPGELIQAKDYINTSKDENVPKVRPNTESGSDIPLQVELSASGWTTYQIDLPAAGEYTLTLHMKSTASKKLGFYGAGFKKISSVTVASTGGVWKDVDVKITLPAGQSELTVYNAESPSVFISSLKLTTDASGIDAPRATSPTAREGYYTLDGCRVSKPTRPGVYIHNGRKIVIR